MAKKTLAEQIAELNKPKTDFDIEDDLKDNVFEDNGELNSEASDGEELNKEHYVKVSKSKLRDQISTPKLGGKYKGNQISRSELYDDEKLESEGDSELEEVSEDDNDNSMEENPSDDIEEEEESGVDLSDISDDQTDESADEDDDHRKSKLAELVANERKSIIGRLSQSASNDALKGYAILSQQKIFDSIIDSRLKVQKSVTNSNLLPANASCMRENSLDTKKTKKYLSNAEDKCFELLDAIFDLRLKLFVKDSVVSSPLKHSKKRSFSNYLEDAKEFDNHLAKYRLNVLKKWSAKISNTSGSTALNAGKFKAISQSAEQQVTNNLADMERLVKRTKLNRRLIKPLGFEVKLDESAQTGVNDEENIDVPRSTNIANEKSAISEIDQIFDDEDFYRILLNDLVDKKIQSSNPANGLTLTLRSAQKAQKLKKNIDTKASKGRKLRYHVQEEISNFETPRGGWKWDDNQIDEFFASLLGQKVNMEEDDVADESEEDVITQGEESIKLFG